MKKLLILLTLYIFGFCACRKELSHTPKLKSPDYTKAMSFLDRKNDSAFYYFNKVVLNTKDSLQIAMSYNYMGLIQSDAGDYFGSQESLSISLKFLNTQNEKDYSCLSSDYNELGITSLNLKNYDFAITYFNLAIRFSKRKEFQLIFSNNIALALQKKHDYIAALDIYRSIITQTKVKETYARVLSNMARTQWLYQPSYNAVPKLLKALSIRNKENDLWGQNASYIHLADYYTLTQPDSALFYADKEYTIARKLNSPDDVLEALGRLIRLDNPHNTKLYFARYQQLNDSIQTTRNSAKNQFALIRYEAEKNKADNLKLQKDNTEKRYEIIKQQILLAVALLLIILVVIGYSRRKKRLEMETLSKIRDHEFKVSKKVHDVVANGLYVVMSEIENQEELSRGVLLDQIEVLYERSRDISYEKPETTNDDFTDKISKLLTSFAGATIKIAVTGNNKAFWSNVSPPVKYELEQILKELMVNMKKHSKASQTVIKFRQDGTRITIDYTDDGIGLPPDIQYGNGLTNTGNRIQAIKGVINFDNKSRKGTRIQIIFPVI